MVTNIHLTLIFSTKACNIWVKTFVLVYHSVVDKVEDDLKDAEDASGHSYPQVDLISLGIGDVFLRLCP